jgi:hypothetical protein
MRNAAALIAVILAAQAPPAQADPRQPPTVEFGGEIVSTAGSEPADTVRVYRAKDKTRIELSAKAGALIQIIDYAADKTHLLMPDTKTFSTEDGVTGTDDPTAPLAHESLKVEEAGAEDLDGRATRRYTMSLPGPNGIEFEAMAWTTAENIVVKMTGRSLDNGKWEPFSQIMKNLKIGPQAANLFVIPSDYKAAAKDDRGPRRRD